MIAPTPDDGHPGLWVDVAGVPRAQPRGRHVGGHVVSTTGPAKIWRQLVKAATLAAMERAAADGGCFPIAGPVQLTIAVRFPTKRAERWGQWRTAIRHTDFDNAEKLIADCLTECGSFGDDGQIARAVYEAVWCQPTAAGVSIAVVPLGARERAQETDLPAWLSVEG